MKELIEWCNINTGFLSGLLSLFTLVVSVITVVVAIKTARLPYKKRIILSMSTEVLFEENALRQINSSVIGVSVSATNIGNRNVNIVFLGLGVKPFFSKMQKLVSTKRVMGGTGVTLPTEMKSVQYSTDELVSCLYRLKKTQKLYVYAIDSEGKEYKKYCGNARKICANLQSVI